MTADLLNLVKNQVNSEFYSAYLYLSMSSWCENEGWRGMANWMRVQAQEERAHALTLHDHLLMLGERATLEQIDAPKQRWQNPLDLFGDALAHEKKITGLINRLATAAMKDEDHAFYQFIQMFVKEQVEEEANATEICRQLRLIDGNTQGMLALDRELGARVFSPPFPGYTA